MAPALARAPARAGMMSAPESMDVVGSPGIGYELGHMRGAQRPAPAIL